MIGSIRQLQSALNFFANTILIHLGCSQIFGMFHSFKGTITLVNTQNVSLIKIVDSSSTQCAETKYSLRIQFLALVCHDT